MGVIPEPGAGRRLHISHRTGYRYGGLVDASFNEVRMTPLHRSGQSLLSHALHITPSATVQSYVDYWGAHVESFDVHQPHDRLEVVSTSTVDTPSHRRNSKRATWATVTSDAVADRWAEYLTATGYVDDAALDESRAGIVEVLRRSTSPQEAVTVAVGLVRDRIAYTPGVTTVYTTAREAWAEGHGVCQDFAHATLALLRAAGIPARYVSGYLHSLEERPGETVAGESHAWVEYWDGDWHAIDPTNDREVGPAHVVVAHGRDYADVPPLKGIYAGGVSEALGVIVEITQQPT
jgi:transglutaminase-like putative cysteine protease